MTWAAACFIVMAFLVIMRLLGVVSRVDEVMQSSRGALADLRNKNLSDVEKERRMRAHALRLLVLFTILTLSLVAAAAVPLGLVGLVDLAGLIALGAVFELLASWEFLLATVGLTVGVLLIPIPRRRA